jgi:hypothetical protein
MGAVKARGMPYSWPNAFNYAPGRNTHDSSPFRVFRKITRIVRDERIGLTM